MKIATFNCNSVRVRTDIILDWLEKENPDILALQELKAQTDQFPYEPFEDIGYHCEVLGKKAHAGVALVSKEAPQKTFHGFRDKESPEEARIIAGKWGKLHVINTYCPQGRDPESEQFQYKLGWFKRLREFFDEFYKSRQQVIWLGDINIAPEPIDVHNSKRIMGHVCHRPEVFEAFENMLDWGFVDVFRKFHKDEAGLYSYFDYRFAGMLKNNRGWRVDHILASKSLAKKAVNSWIDLEPRMKERPSDHTFLVAEFDL